MQNSKLNINQTIDKISEFAPAILFGTMVTIFIITGYLQKEYYTMIFDGILTETMYMSFVIPSVIQVLRMVTGFLSAAFFKKRKMFLGVLVLIFSIWLTSYEHGEAEHMGEYWTTFEIDLSTAVQTENAKILLVRESIISMVRLLVWSALVLELFLAFWLGMKKKKDDDLDASILPENDEVFSSNGRKKKAQKSSKSS